MAFVLDFQEPETLSSLPAALSAFGTRKIRKHLKSRGGCLTCRTRRVKCGEEKPECKKCLRVGSICGYEKKQLHTHARLEVKVSEKTARLQSSSSTETTRTTSASSPDSPGLQLSPFSESRTILSIINGSTSNASSSRAASSNFNDHLGIGSLDPVERFNMQDLDTLRKWQWRTMSTLGSKDRMQLYESAYTKLTFSHPFLFHVVLTVTLMHDRQLYLDTSTDTENAIAYHWGEGASLLNNKIRYGFAPSERDALWACAGMLGCLSFANLRGTILAEAWPLAPASSNDLGWLKMSRGKKVIWKLADPLRKDSLFSELGPDFTSMREVSSLSLVTASADGETDVARLVRYCNIRPTATQDTNAYFGSVSVLAELRDVQCNGVTIMQFFRFLGCMHEDFQGLLENKEPGAMIVLAFWYAKASHLKRWWLWPRANLEFQAICIYLTWYHAYDEALMTLVDDAKLIFDGLT